MFRIAVVLVAAFALASCKKQSSSADRVVMFDKNDSKMNAAIEKARSSVDIFIKALNKPRANQDGFSVKMAVKDGGGVEHMWLSDVTYVGDTFHGKINNDPELVKSVKFGQKVSVKTKEISDWMYIDNGVLVGGETMRVMRNSLSPKERADFDKSIPFVIK